MKKVESFSLKEEEEEEEKEACSLDDRELRDFFFYRKIKKKLQQKPKFCICRCAYAFCMLVLYFQSVSKIIYHAR